MLQIEKWAEGKPPAFVIFATFYASSAAPAWASFVHALDGQKFPLVDQDQPPLQDWLLLYRKFHQMLRFIESSSSPLSAKRFATKKPNTGGNFDSFIKFNKEKTPSKSSDRYERLLGEFVTVKDDKNIRTLLKLIIRDYKRRAKKVTTNSPEYDDEIFEMEYLYFFARVGIPSFLLYRQLPFFIFRKARQGHFESIKKLAHLDQSAIFDTKISRHIHRLRGTSPQKHRQIMEALTKPPKERVTIQKVKIIAASLISFIGSILSYEPTEPEIRELFDAVAQDFGNGEIDTDLPESSHTFYMAIQRDIPLWREAVVSLT